VSAGSPIDPAQFANLLEMTGGDFAFVDDLVDTYLEEGTGLVDALRDAAAAGSVADLVRPAHSMKSSSLNVGATGLADLCRSLEELARGGAIPDAPERVAAIATEFDAVRSALLEERARRAAG
jgi:HPt (histidine-containing phosphotransfer) domain-containing protein